MNIIEANNLFNKWRDRIEWSVRDVMTHTGVNEVTFMRAVDKKHSPNSTTINSFVEKMPFPKETLILPFLDGVDMQTQSQCNWLTFYLDRHDIDSAVPIFNQLSKNKLFTQDINLQFLLCKKAQLWVLQKKSLDIIEQVINEALHITNKERLDLTGKPLILYEPELKHVLAQAYFAHGKIAEAINLLTGVKHGLNHLPSDDRNKEKRLAPVLLSLAKYQLSYHDIDACIASCDEGFNISARRNHGQLCPDFQFVKIQALKLGSKIDADALSTSLNSVCAGFVLLNEKEKMDQLLQYAHAQGINIDESLSAYFPQDYKKTPYERLNPVTPNKKDTMLSQFRNNAGLTQQEVSNGLRHFSAYSRLEVEATKIPDAYFTEAVMQRMGRDIESDRSFIVSSKQFESLKLREEILALTSALKYKEAELKLKALSNMKDYKNGAGLQFILIVRANIYEEKYGMNKTYYKLLLESIRVTIPDFKLDNITKYPLTMIEATIVMNIANYYKNKKNSEFMQASNVYEMLLENITHRWFDELLIASLFATISYNYSSCVGQLEQRDKALNVLENAIKKEVKWGRLTMLPYLLYNKCFNIQQLKGNTHEVCALYKLCYYSANLFAKHGQKENAALANKKLKQHWGIDLSICWAS